jgi:uncharacterized protein (TIGR02246 family)
VTNGQSDESDRKEIAEIVASYETAFNGNDAKAMNALFSDDTIFVNFGGNLVFGAEDLYRAQAFVFDPGGPLENVEVRYLVESIRFLTPDIAVAHTRQQSADLTSGATDQMASIFTLVLMRDEQRRWRIRVGQNTPVAAPP